MVTKLHVILLTKAVSNCHNRLIFGDIMTKLAHDNGLVPEEIYNKKGKTPEVTILQQVLAYNITRLMRRSLLVPSVDAAQCYNGIAHVVASLMLRTYIDR